MLMSRTFVLALLAQLDFAAMLQLPALQSRCAAARTSVCMAASNDNDWESSYMDELRHRIRSSSSKTLLSGDPGEVLQNLPNVWVLIFNPGTVDEGVYTLQGKTAPEAPYVLAFEKADEAQRFAQQLQAEEFDLPQPMQWPAEQVVQFCQTAQFELGVVPTGAVVTPPTHNEYDEEAFGRVAIDEETTPFGTPEEIDEERERLERLFGL